MAERQVTGPVSLTSALLVAQWPAWLLLVGSSWLPDALGVLSVLLAGGVISSGLHEAGHALAYWQVSGRGRSVVLRTRFTMALAIRTKASVTSRFVLAAGPALPVVVGGALCMAALATGHLTLWLLVGVCGLHAFGLLPGNSDGDRIWGLA